MGTINLSPSKIEMIERCGLQYEFLKTVGPVPPGVNLHIGSAVHAAAELNHRQKIASFTDLEGNYLADCGAESFENKLAKEGLYLPTKRERQNKQRIIGQTKDLIAGTKYRRGFVKLYAESVAPKVQPEEVEKWVELLFPSIDVLLRGRIDVFTRDRWLMDIKSGQKRRPASDAHNSAQLSFYSLWLEKQGSRPRKISYEYLYVAKTIEEAYSHRTTMKKPDYDRLMHRIAFAAKAIRLGVFHPAAPGSWICSQAFCGWFDRCKHAQRQY